MLIIIDASHLSFVQKTILEMQKTTQLFLSVLFLAINTLSLYGQDLSSDSPVEVLMIGSFHFDNPGLDVIKTKSFDVLTPKVQDELEFITDRIQEYAPTKIFVEYPYERQERLDSLYQSYRYQISRGTVEENPRRSELYQLAFRAANKLGLEQLHAVDYRHTSFPFDSLMRVASQAGQSELIGELNRIIEEMTKAQNEQYESTDSVIELLIDGNTAESRQDNLGTYLDYLALAGERENFVGGYLVSEWYKRNIYIWTLIQKALDAGDERIMVLFGSGHTAVFDRLIHGSKKWKITELETLLGEK